MLETRDKKQDKILRSNFQSVKSPLEEKRLKEYKSEEKTIVNIFPSSGK